MAAVYLAEDLKHHRQVAVKVMKPEIAHTMGSDRFQREIGIARAAEPSPRPFLCSTPGPRKAVFSM
jgi:serine/threonine-protein kinase